MIKTLGKTFLNGAQFTTDPRIQRQWAPRRSRLAGIEGSTTQQDFGRFARDMRLTLTSNGNFMNRSLKAQIESLMFERLGSYTYSDYQGIEGDVLIVDFDAVPTFIKDGVGVLFEYTLVLDMLRLRTLDFVDYTGA